MFVYLGQVHYRVFLFLVVSFPIIPGNPCRPWFQFEMYRSVVLRFLCRRILRMCPMPREERSDIMTTGGQGRTIFNEAIRKKELTCSRFRVSVGALSRPDFYKLCHRSEHYPEAVKDTAHKLTLTQIRAIRPGRGGERPWSGLRSSILSPNRALLFCITVPEPSGMGALGILDGLNPNISDLRHLLVGCYGARRHSSF